MREARVEPTPFSAVDKARSTMPGSLWQRGAGSRRSGSQWLHMVYHARITSIRDRIEKLDNTTAGSPKT